MSLLNNTINNINESINNKINNNTINNNTINNNKIINYEYYKESPNNINNIPISHGKIASTPKLLII